MPVSPPVDAALIAMPFERMPVFADVAAARLMPADFLPLDDAFDTPLLPAFR